MVKIGGGGIFAKQKRLASLFDGGEPLVSTVKTQEDFIGSRVAIARRLSASAFTACSVGFLYGHGWWWLRVERGGDRNLPPCSLLIQVCQNKPACASMLFQDLCEGLAGG